MAERVRLRSGLVAEKAHLDRLTDDQLGQVLGATDERAAQVALDGFLAQGHLTAGPKPAPAVDTRSANAAFRTPLPERAATPGGAIVGLDPRIHGRRTPDANAAVQRDADAIQRVVAPSVLPTLGALPGIALAPANPAAGILASTGGAMLGEMGNQALGITEPDPVQVGLTGALEFAAPFGGALGGPAKRMVARNAPGSRFLLKTAAIRQAEGLPAEHIPVPRASDELFDLVRGADPGIPIGPFHEVLKPWREAQAKLAPAVKAKRVEMLAGQIENLANPQTGEIPFQVLWENTKRVGALLRDARRAGKDKLAGDLSQVFRAGREAMESAAKAAPEASGALSALRAANEAFRREAVRDEIADRIANAIGKPRTGDGAREFRPGDVLDALTSHKPQHRPFQEDVKRALSPEERRGIVATLEALTKIKPLPAARGAEVGSGRRLGGVLGGAGVGGAVGGGLAGALSGGDATMTVLGTGLGTAAGAGIASKAGDIIADMLLKDDAGRALILRWMQAPTRFDAPVLRVMAAAAAGQLAESVKVGGEMMPRTPMRQP